MTDERDERPVEPTSEPVGDHSPLQLFAEDRGNHDAPVPGRPAESEEPPEPGPPPRTRRHRRGGLVSCAVVLVVVLALLVGGIVLVFAGMDRVRGLFAGPPDYSGSGTGSVMVQVQSGDSSAVIGRRLKSDGVVKSVEAFTKAAADNPKSRGIQVGFYELRKQMSADAALAVLVDPSNLVQSTVTIPEGARVRQIVDAIVAHTDLRRGAVTKALSEPAAIGLPAAAKGNPEGYLFPATYSVAPNMTAEELIAAMVAKSKEVLGSLDVGARAKALGLTSEQVVTVASILQYEANRAQDYPKVARVIYNRLDQGMALQMDSTVSYVSGRAGDVWTTPSERKSDSLYNTYQHTGLPPGPIGSPGEETLRAALNPAKGNWLYFVPDFKKGITLFTDNYSQHLRNVAQAKEYCRTHDVC